MENEIVLRCYQGGWALEGLDWRNLLWLLAFAALFAVLAWLFFLRRDIRVSGEGSWRLPGWRRRLGKRGGELL